MKCSFCGKNIWKGTGREHVKNDGKVVSFCSSKCRKNMLKLKRDPKKLKWARAKQV